MFESTGGEVPEEGAAAGAPRPRAADGGSQEGVDDSSPVEPNGVWAEHDWSGVPVLPASDEPPPGWQPENGWLDELEYPQLGPVSWLDQVKPSGRLMCELEELPADLVESDSDAVEMVAHWARLESYCALRKRTAAAALARRTVMADGLAPLKNLDVRTSEPNIAGDELALRLGIGKRAAQTLVRSGRAFYGVGIPTADALAAGEIDAAKADLIVAGVEDLEPDAALDVQYEVLAKAAHLPSGRLRRELATARAAVDTAHFEQRCQAAAAKRRVDRPRVLPDGMASVYAVMPAVEATQLYRAIDAAARSAKAVGDPRTLDQLRADAFALMGSAAVRTGWIGACQRPHMDDSPAGATAAAKVAAGAGAGADGDGYGGSGLVLSPRRHRGGAGQTREPLPPPRAATSTAVPACHPPPHPPPPDPLPSSVGASGSPPSPSDLPDQPSPGSAERRRGDVEASRDASPREGTDLGCVMRVGVIGGRTAHVRVVIPLTTAMGGIEVPRTDGAVVGADEPAELEGYGPIPASVARALAAGGPWARMVTDPVDRTVLEVSSDNYEPPPAMAALVRAREPECVSPSCSVPSDSCDLHHRIPWPVGPTSVTNLDPGCRRDHLLLTHGGWSYVVDAAGCRTWTTAAGLVYVEDPSGKLTLRKPTPNPATPTHSAEEVRRREDGPPPF